MGMCTTRLTEAAPFDPPGHGGLAETAAGTTPRPVAEDGQLPASMLVIRPTR